MLVNSTGRTSSLFLKGLYEVVDDPSSDSIISWSKSNKSFIIWSLTEFQRKILLNSQTILCLTVKMFFEELKNHGFKKMKGEHHFEFGHKKYFVKGKPKLIKKMHAEAAYEKRKREDIKAYNEMKAGEMQLATSFANLTL